jgi:hypothetical protein
MQRQCNNDNTNGQQRQRQGRGQRIEQMTRTTILILILSAMIYFVMCVLPNTIEGQRRKYVAMTGANRLDYYDEGQKTSADDLVYRRVNGDDDDEEARNEERTQHDSADASSRANDVADDDASSLAIEESAEKAGLDYTRLPVAQLKGDKLQCKCGKYQCESFDQPRVSYVVSKDIEDVREILKVLNAIDAGASKAKDCEVLVNADALKSSSSSNSLSGINSLIDLIKAQGGFKDALASYRNEPLERIVLVKSEKHQNNDLVLERLVSGALSAKIRFVENSKKNIDEAPEEMKTTVLKRLRSIDQRSTTPTSKNDVLPRVSFALQYFKRPNLVQKIATQLVGYATKYNFPIEVLINDDSATEIQEWHEALEKIPHAIVCAGNVHEIRGYNRLALMSRAQIVAVIQDDDLPPLEPNWLIQAEDNFYEHKNLALIAGLVGQIQGGPDTGRWGKQRGRHVKQIPYYDKKGRPFMFVSWANIGPFVLKRDAFLMSGMFHDSYSCRGDPGIGFDYEYGIRLWRNNKEVALTIMQFRYHVGASRSSGTRSSVAMKTRRDSIEARNTKLIHNVHKGFYVNHAPEGANKSPKAKAMTTRQICKAAALPNLANKRLIRNKKG